MKPRRLAPLLIVVTLLVATQARAQSDCDAERMVDRLMQLFPPAPTQKRMESARALGLCPAPGAEGALAAALAHDPEVAVRVEAATTLGRLWTPVALQALRATLTPQQPLVLRSHTLRLLVEKGDTVSGNWILTSPQAEDGFRAVALDALIKAGQTPPDEVLAGLTDLGPELAAKIRQAQVERSVAARPPVAPAFPPPAAPNRSTPVAPTPPAFSSAEPGAEPLPTLSPPKTAPSGARLHPPISAAPTPTPAGPPDGTSLAVTTSIIAGSLWGGGLSLLAQQDSPGVVMLLGSAGAVIGGGTAWGLTRFGLRPSPGQAMWFTNATGWGTLAGLMAWAGSGSDNPKLKYGLLVGGETLGVAAGIWGARRFGWTPGQVLLANSLVVAGDVGLIGLERWRSSTSVLSVPQAAGYGTAPLMLLSALASRALRPSTEDLHLAAISSFAAAWTAGLVASGAAEASLLGEHRGQGALLTGLGFGYLGGIAAGAVTDVPVARTYAGLTGLLTGSLLGTGFHMLVDPDHAIRWKLGAGLGGAGLGLAAFSGYRFLSPGPRAPSMTMAGFLYGAGPWTIAALAASTGQPADARLPGGQLALGTTGAIAGYLLSRHFEPDANDQGTALLTTALGMGAGAGLAKLTTAQAGTPELVGVLGGAGVGLVSGALLAHHTDLRAIDAAGALSGATYGLLIGSLAPTLSLPEWSEGRKTTGGSWLGLSAGAIAGVGLTRLTGADGAAIAVPSVAGILGLGVGVGTGMAWPDATGRPGRIGAVAGPVTFIGLSMLAEHRLQLSQGLRSSAGGLTLTGALAGAGYGWLAGALVSPNGDAPRSDRQRAGATLAGASAGTAASLLLSKRYEPNAVDQFTTVGAGLLGTSLGAGLSGLIFSATDDPEDRHLPALTLGGATVGLVGGALVARATELRGPDFAAGVLGAGSGFLIGTLAPTLNRPAWEDDRRSTGGGRLGLALGAIGAITAAHLTDADGARVAVTATGGGLGALAGLGAGLMPRDPSSQPARIGTVAGTLSFTALAIAADHRLKLHDGLGPSAGGLSILGGGAGLAEGLLLAGAIDERGLVSEAGNRQLAGGALLGATVGLTGGLVLSKFVQPSAADEGVVAGAGLLGGMLGRGLAVMASESDGRPQTLSTLAGSLAGLGAAAALEHTSPLTAPDMLALPLGLAYGGLVGSLGPSLGHAQWDWERPEQGGAMAGVAAGGLLAVAARHLTDATPATIGWATLGAADGLLTGVGAGLLLDAEDHSRAQRIGAIAGTTIGMGLGAAIWPRVHLERDDRLALSAAIGLAGWTGFWAPSLGHAQWDTVAGEKREGSVMAAAGLTSFVASAVVPRLHLDADLLSDALLLDGLLTGAGAGAGALVSMRDDAPVWGLLGAGTAGLVLGGALHRHIDLGADDAPLLSLATLEGVWYGAWLPHLWTQSVTPRAQAGALAAVGLGSAALAIGASPFVSLDGTQAGEIGLGSAIGASLAGGAALLSSTMGPEAKTGLMLGGTSVGLVGSAALAPHLTLREGAGSFAATGAALGAAEGLVFAWAGRGEGRNDYAGALLIGTSVGTTLGLASAAAPRFTLQRGLASAGFAAWGAWMGAFSGAFFNRDSHEVTLGGLAGANVGFLAGYGLVRSDLVEPRDFGWLSLAGAIGTVAGGGVGAAFSRKDAPGPILAGLAIGPAVGMSAGALILPSLRRLSDRASTAFLRAPRVAGMHFEFPARDGQSEGPAHASVSSAELLAHKEPPSLLRRAGRRLSTLVGVESWTPIVGSLPPAPGTAGPPPFLIGAAGILR